MENVDENGNMGGIARAMEISKQRREAERIEHNKQLGEPVFFVPAEEHEGMAEGHGVGWFHINGHMVAYWRYSNGYRQTPMMLLQDGLVDRLHKAVRKDFDEFIELQISNHYVHSSLALVIAESLGLKHVRKLPNGNYATVYVDEDYSGEWFVGLYLTEAKEWANKPEWSGFSEAEAVKNMWEL